MWVGTSSGLYVVNSDGSGLTPVANAGRVFDPAWRPTSPSPTATPVPSSATPAAPTATTPAPTATPAPVVGGIIAFNSCSSDLSGREDISLINTDGTGFTVLAHVPGSRLGHPAWFPVGTRIAYHARRAGAYSVWVMNADGSEQTQLTKASVNGLWPTWSPDGTRIAFTNFDTQTEGHLTYVMNADGSDVHPLMSAGAGNDLLPTWAPNGTILFVRAEGAAGARGGDLSGDVFAVKSDGTGLVQLTTLGNVGDFALSPDGTKIAVFDVIQKRLFVLPTDASTTAPLTLVDSVAAGLNPGLPSLFCRVLAPTWSPDGEAVALTCGGVGTLGCSGIYVVHADGSGLGPIPGTRKGGDPAWRPR